MRLAIQQRAALVPVLCMGELDTLRNLIDMPDLQVCSLGLLVVRRALCAVCVTA